MTRAGLDSNPIAAVRSARPAAAIEPPPVSRLALNLITIGSQHRLEDILDGCVRRGITAVSPWRQHYERMGVAHASRAIRERGLSVNTVCRIAGFGSADSSDAWQAALREGFHTIDEAAEMKARFVTVTGGGIAPVSKDVTAARKRIRDGVAALLAHARAAGIPLALESLHPMTAADRGAISSLGLAHAMARELGDGVGVLVDAYNTWWDPNLEPEIAALGSLISGFQVSDWLIPTSDLAFDRGMMGDGVIDLRAMRGMVEDAGFAGLIEVEVLSHRWAAREVDDVLDTLVERFMTCC
jgi:sugar phosphate isomerase/epimerase